MISEANFADLGADLGMLASCLKRLCFPQVFGVGAADPCFKAEDGPEPSAQKERTKRLIRFAEAQGFPGSTGV
jgi:hypothetical protein